MIGKLLEHSVTPFDGQQLIAASVFTESTPNSENVRKYTKRTCVKYMVTELGDAFWKNLNCILNISEEKTRSEENKCKGKANIMQ